MFNHQKTGSIRTFLAITALGMVASLTITRWGVRTPQESKAELFQPADIGPSTGTPTSGRLANGSTLEISSLFPGMASRPNDPLAALRISESSLGRTPPQSKPLPRILFNPGFQRDYIAENILDDMIKKYHSDMNRTRESDELEVVEGALNSPRLMTESTAAE